MKEFFPLLQTTSLFFGMKAEDLEAMLGCLGAAVVRIAKGDPIFLEGDEAGFVGVVLDGCVQVVREDFYGNRSILTHAEKGDLFAETFACANIETMPVSGYAVKDSLIMLLSCQKMLTVCSATCLFHNQLVKNLLKVVAQKNLNLNSKIQFMSQKTTKEKIMAYLLDQAKQKNTTEFTIPLNRQALADFLGVERSAMSAELSKLRKEGILDSKGSWFRLLKS